MSPNLGRRLHLQAVLPDRDNAMQRNTPSLFLVGGIVAVGLALGPSLSLATANAGAPVTQDPIEPPVEDPVEDPGEDPVQLALIAKVQELERKLAALETWVAGQQTQATLTVAALAEAEAAGFTAGINPKSREILLAAWRAEAAQLQGPAPEQTPADKTLRDRR